MIPFILTGPLTAVHGVVLMILFVLFIAYPASREFRRSTPVFRNAEILEKIEVGGSGATTVVTIDDPISDKPTNKPPFVVTMPFNKGRRCSVPPSPPWCSPSRTYS